MKTLREILESENYFAFIDGDHNPDVVERELVEAYNNANKGDVILLHDCNPPTELHQKVPRMQNEWCGQVWRVCKGFKEKYRLAKTEYIDEQYGVFKIKKTTPKNIKLGFTDFETEFKDFDISCLK